MDFFKNRERIAFWSALSVAAVETLRQWALGDYRGNSSAAADFAAVFACNWLIWKFNFFVDDYQSRLSFSAPPRLFLFRALLSFVAGTAVVVVIEYLVHQFFREEGENLLFYFLRGIFHNAVILVFYYALQLQRRHRNVALENAKLKAENVRAQLDLLRQQVNPHFLFNALNTLKSMVKSSDPQTPEFIIHLSEVYRFLLTSNPRPHVTIREELEMLGSYAFLLKTRFNENFTLKTELPPGLMETVTPPLTFQLLVENAIKHNIISKEKPLKVEIFCPDENHIAVRNNLQAKKSVEVSTGAGLNNIQQRYKLLDGKDIRIEKNDLYFTVILPVIKLPYENSDRGR